MTYSAQKAALTRAVKSGDPNKVIAACTAAKAQWDRTGMWPDEWTRWQRALDDITPIGQWSRILLEDLT